MNEYFNQWFADLINYLPTLLAAIAVLIVGWLLAAIIAAVVRRVLDRISLDDRLAGMVRGGEQTPAERIRGGKLDLEGCLLADHLCNDHRVPSSVKSDDRFSAARPLLNQILGFIPGLLAALLRSLSPAGGNLPAIARHTGYECLRTGAPAFHRCSGETPDRVTISQTLGNIVYWLVACFPAGNPGSAEFAGSWSCPAGRR
jgi:hypothetical protein